jgi:hypothetical protein
MSVSDVADGKARRLQDLFEDVFVKCGGPEDAGMFGSIEWGSNDYFFSPGAARIAMPLILSHKGVKCAAPRLSALVILVAKHSGTAIPFVPES